MELNAIDRAMLVEKYKTIIITNVSILVSDFFNCKSNIIRNSFLISKLPI